MKIVVLLLALLAFSCSYPSYVEPEAQLPHASISVEKTPTALGKGIPKLAILYVNRLPFKRSSIDDLKLAPGKNSLRVRVLSNGRTTAETEISFEAQAGAQYHVDRASDAIYHIITIKNKATGKAVVRQSIKKVYKPMETFRPTNHDLDGVLRPTHSPFDTYESHVGF